MSNRRGLGPHASRRGLLKAGLAIGTLALGQRAALGQSGGAHVHMPEAPHILRRRRVQTGR